MSYPSSSLILLWRLGHCVMYLESTNHNALRGYLRIKAELLINVGTYCTPSNLKRVDEKGKECSKPVNMTISGGGARRAKIGLLKTHSKWAKTNDE